MQVVDDPLALVGACTGPSSPTVNGTSTTGATATASPAPGSTPTPDPGLDATTHARLHVVALNRAGGNVDVFVDGAIVNNGGQAQVDVPLGT